MCQTCTRWKPTSSVSRNAQPICTYCEPSSTWRRSMRSASTPPNSENRKIGRPFEHLVERQQERGVGERVDQPALRDDLHPGADAGRARADPHQAEVAILKSFEDPAKHSDRAAAG